MKLRCVAAMTGTLMLAAVNAEAQELNCEVTVNVENIASGQRDYLRTFEADVKKYINNNRYTDEDLGGERIDCSMNVFFLPGSSENRYQAQVVVVSQRPVYNGNEKSGKNTQVIRILDEKWDFTYVPNQPMNKDDYRFDPVTSFLDFYAYLIIGLDLETYTELSGARCLQKALNICNLATSTAYSSGWQAAATGSYSRFGYLDELMNMKNQQFREAFYSYHFDGLDLLATQPQLGLDKILKSIESIAELRKQNPRTILVKTFFDSKYLEIADVFLVWPDRGVYDRITTADPQHQGTYDTYRQR